MRSVWVLRSLLGIMLLASPSEASAQQTPTEPSATAAETPLPTRTPDPRCGFPDAVSTAELYPAAVKQYERLLATPGTECAEAGYIDAQLAQTPEPQPTEVPTPFKAAEKLLALGYEDEAKAEFIKVVTANPGADIPESLNRFDDNSFNDGFRAAVVASLEWVPTKFSAIMSVLLPLLGLGLGIMLIWRIASLWRRRERVAVVDIAAFDTGSSGSSIGTTIAELIQLSYKKVQDGDRPGTTKLVIDAAAAEPTDLKAELLPGASGLLIQLYTHVKKLLFVPYILGGSLTSDPGKGAGIVLTLRKRNEICAIETLWFREYFGVSTTEPKGDGPAANDYMALAETAAIWLHATLAAATPRTEETRPAALVAPPNEIGLHTRWRRWDSFALFRNSVRALGWGETDSAIRLLSRSLEKDPGFIPALVNYSTLRLQTMAGAKDADSKVVEASYENYLQVLASIHDSKGYPATDHRVRPKVLFNYLAAIDYVAGWDSPKFAAGTSKLIEEVDNLVDQWADRPVSDEYAEQRDAIAPFTLLSLTVKLREADTEKNRRDITEEYSRVFERITPPKMFGQRTAYGQACFCAAAYHHLKSDRNAWATRALNHLRVALELEPKSSSWAKEDPSLLPLRVSKQYKDVFQAIVCPKDQEEPKPPVRSEHVIIFGPDAAKPQEARTWREWISKLLWWRREFGTAR